MKRREIRKPSAEYFRRRFELIEKATHEQAMTAADEIDHLYQRTMREVDGKIREWVQRVAENNQVSLEDARKLLNARELEEFRWDVMEYIKRGQENALDQRWMKELENASARYHIQQYERLRIDLDQAFQELYTQQERIMQSTLEGVYKSAYDASIDAIMQGVQAIPGKVSGRYGGMARALFEPWAVDAKTWSDRLWTDKARLAQTIKQELFRMAATGESPDKAISKVQKTFATSRYNAFRLVQTEAAYVSEEASFDSYKDTGVEEYVIIATMDNLTSEICRSMNNKHFRIEEREVGVTAPPFHPNCRTTTAPYVDDEIERRHQ